MPIIYDLEIINAIPSGAPDARYSYCKGWTDFEGMGISVIGAYDTDHPRSRVFLADNSADFQALIKESGMIVGFNNHCFDDRLLVANGFDLEGIWRLDLAALIWGAAGIPRGEHPSGFGLDAICRANKMPGKTGDGALAPYDWQNGRIGRVIDYCLGDVAATLRLYQRLLSAGGCVDPRTEQWLSVVVPR